MATMTQNRLTVVSYPISIHIHFGRILCKRRKVNRLLFIWKPHINVKQNIIQNIQRREKKARRPYRDQHFAWNFIQWKFIGNHMTNKLLSTLNGTMALALYTFSIICLILLAGKSFFPPAHPWFFFSLFGHHQIYLLKRMYLVFWCLYIFTKPIKLIFMWQMHRENEK